MAASSSAVIHSEDQPGAVSTLEYGQPSEVGGEDEWEYEYSTTETETYYLTVELSYPEFKDTSVQVPHHSRGGFYKNWLEAPSSTNPSSDKKIQKRAAGPEGTVDADNNDDDNDEEVEVEPNDDDDEDMVDVDPTPVDKGKGVDRGEDSSRKQSQSKQHRGIGTHTSKKRDAEQPIHDIQVVELHSKNPIFSYRGRVFEGQWAEVVGTEAILVNHEQGQGLPALRNLPGGVDFLAASASRILTKEKELKPKVAKEDTLAPIKAEWNIRIPAGKDRTGERRQQSQFLENLIALKKKKGEKDNVTVWALDGEGKDFRDDKDPDYRPRRKKGKTVATTGDAGDGLPGNQKARGGRGLKRGGRQRFATLLREEERAEMASMSSLSTPTPLQWEDLARRGDAGNEEPD